MHKIVGIDLGASAVKAVALEASFRSHVIRDYRALALGPAGEGEEPKTYAERALAPLKALALDDWFKADTVVCALPAALVATHLITLPFGDQRRVDQALKFEIEGLIPFDLDEVVFDSHVVSRTRDRTELIVAVARKDDLERTLSLFSEVGVDPAVVTFSALALANLQANGYLEETTREPGAPEPETEALVDVGAERTNVLITRGGQVRFCRTIATGGGLVTRTLEGSGVMEPGTAEDLKRSLSLEEPSSPEAGAALERAVSMLVRELRSTFAGHFARTKEKVARLVLCGGGARLGGLPRTLAHTLGLSVALLELQGGHAFPAPQELLPGTLALSLGLQATQAARASRLNFRKGAYASAKAQVAWRTKLGAIGVMAAVLLVLLGVSTWARLHALSQREAQLDHALCATTRRILGTCETDYRVALGKLKGQGSPAAAIPKWSAVDLVKAVSGAFPPGSDSILDDLDVVDDRVTLKGSAKSYQSVDDLVGALQRHKCFGDIQKGDLLKGSDNRIHFRLDARYSCEGSKREGS